MRAEEIVAARPAWRRSPSGVVFARYQAGSWRAGAPSFGNPDTKYHNVIEMYDADWNTPSALKLDVIAHEIGHTIEFAGYGTLDSPAYFLWHDSKWCEIFPMARSRGDSPRVARRAA